MSASVHILYLPACALADRLFFKQMALTLSRTATKGRYLLVHGSREDGPVEEAGRCTDSGGDRLRDLDAELREQNKRIVAGLTEEGVSAVSIQGSDMGLFTIDTEGRALCRVPATIHAVFRPGVVLVVSLLVRTLGSYSGELDPLWALPALAEEFAREGPAEIVVVEPDDTAEGKLSGEWMESLTLSLDKEGRHTGISRTTVGRLLRNGAL